jgi:hypothetical protein
MPMSDLAVLYPEPEIVLLGNKRVEVRAVRLKDLEHYGKTAAAAVEIAAAPSIQGINAFMSRYSRDLRRVLYTCTSLSRWYVWRLPAMTAFQLFVQVVRVNADFFALALADLVALLAGAQSSKG